MSKIVFSGKSPKCVECKKLYSLKKADENEELLMHLTGQCPHCQAKNNLNAANFSQEEITQATALVNERRATIPPKIENSGKIVYETITNVIEKLSPETLLSLQEKDYTFQTFGIRFPLIKHIDSSGSEEVKEQLKVKGRARYSSKLLNVQGSSYAITNDIYSHNVPKVLDWAKAI